MRTEKVRDTMTEWLESDGLEQPIDFEQSIARHIRLLRQTREYRAPKLKKQKKKKRKKNKCALRDIFRKFPSNLYERGTSAETGTEVKEARSWKEHRQTRAI